jgi:mannose-1-phosphate guanylyltransferase/mannose-6-phosphate isomerase
VRFQWFNGLVLPSDHVILKPAAFACVAEAAAQVAKEGYLVTFGIDPTEPHTGYGYIRRGPKMADNAGAFEVDAFVEKPDTAQATGFIEEGGYYWNSGMFMLKAATFMDELRRFEPEIARQTALSLDLAKHDDDFVRLDAGAFQDCPNMSVDYAVMERTNRAAVIVGADLGWNDIGSWAALAKIAESDVQGNALLGDVLTEDVTNSYIRAEHRTVAAIGLNNIVIVETADAVLVTHRDSTQNVKRIVER